MSTPSVLVVNFSFPLKNNLVDPPSVNKRPFALTEAFVIATKPVSYTHLRAHETG